MEVELSRRALLKAAGGVAALGATGATATVEVGDMAIGEATRVDGTDIWVGPDAGTADVDPDTARVYKAVDTQIEYYGTGSSWEQMGVGSQSEPVPEGHFDSLSADDATINDIGAKLADEEYRDGAPARRIVHENSESMLATVGTVVPTTPTRLVPTEESGITSTGWTELSSLYYGWLESPPNLVPIFRGVFDIQSNDSGETLQVRVRHVTNDGSESDVALSVQTGTGTDREQIHDQVYFNEEASPGTGSHQSFIKWVVEAKVSGGTTGGTVYPASAIILEHEVV